MLDRLIDPLRYPEFLPGLIAGLAALAAVAAARAFASRGANRVRARWPRPRSAAGAGRVPSVGEGASATHDPAASAGRARPPMGLALAAAVVAGLAWTARVPGALLAGLLLLLLAAGVAWTVAGPRRHGPASLRIGAAVLSAALAVAGVGVLTAPLGSLASPGRLAATAGGACVVAGLVAFDQWSPHRGLAPLLVLVTAGGVYATVPDTEAARVLLAAALPCALLGWPYPSARLGRLGALATGGVLVWVVAAGGHGRAGSVVGGLASVGLLLADPAARAVARRSLLDRVGTGPLPGALIAALHGGSVLVAARVAGLRASAAAAAAIALPLLALCAALLAGRPQRRLSRPTE